MKLSLTQVQYITVWCIVFVPTGEIIQEGPYDQLRQEYEGAEDFLLVQYELEMDGEVVTGYTGAQHYIGTGETIYTLPASYVKKVKEIKL